jgi:membrane associated rhomboid family serine protease
MADLRMRGFNQIPPVIKNLIIINTLVWIAELTFGEPFINALDLHFHLSPDFHIWQLVTYMFLHATPFDWIFHLLFNMFALWMFGSTLENMWGSKRFLIFYLICGVGAALMQMGALAIEWNMLLNSYNAQNITQAEFIARGAPIYNSTALGASGAVMGVMVAFGYTFPNTEFYMIPIPIPIKAKYLVIGYVLLDLFGGINPRYGDNVAHFAHLGGAIIGFILVVTMNRSNRKTFY